MKITVSLLSFLALSCGSLNAGPLTGPAYPPPGGVTFSGSGPGSGSGGKTFSYSGFDNTAYGSLYWGPTSVLNIANQNDTGVADMTYTGLSGADYIFNSTQNWAFQQSNSTVQSLATRFRMTVIGLGAVDTEAHLGATADLSFSSFNPSFPLFQVTGGFSANFFFEVADPRSPGTWTGVNTYQNAVNNSTTHNQTSVKFGFFTTPAIAPVPEPGTVFLFGGGALALVAFARRKLVR